MNAGTILLAICILLIHHLRKQGSSDPFDQISSSTGLMGATDTIWLMQRKRMSQTANLLLTGRDMDERTLYLREENCIWTLESEKTAEEQELKPFFFYAFHSFTGAYRRIKFKMFNNNKQHPRIAFIKPCGGVVYSRYSADALSSFMVTGMSGSARRLSIKRAASRPMRWVGCLTR